MNIGLHRFTLLVTSATFILILAGALVTSNAAGLAAPDWPLSYGQFFPKMVGGLFYEHGHRLIASTVGLLVIVLNFYLWRREARRWVRRLGLVALGVVIAQGLLGGLTVILMLPLAVSTAHACLAQLFFCIMVSLSLFTAPSWHMRREMVTKTDEWTIPLWASAAVVAIFLQLVLGATLRHSAAWDQHLPTELLIAHITGALVVTLVLGSVLVKILRQHPAVRPLARPARLAAVLLVLQLFLGVAAYVTRRGSPEDPQPLNPMVSVTVAHVACGALVLAVTLVLTLRAFQLLTGFQPLVAIRQSSKVRGRTLEVIN